MAADLAQVADHWERVQGALDNAGRLRAELDDGLVPRASIAAALASERVVGNVGESLKMVDNQSDRQVLALVDQYASRLGVEAPVLRGLIRMREIIVHRHWDVEPARIDNVLNVQFPQLDKLFGSVRICRAGVRLRAAEPSMAGEAVSAVLGVADFGATGGADGFLAVFSDASRGLGAVWVGGGSASLGADLRWAERG